MKVLPAIKTTIILLLLSLSLLACTQKEETRNVFRLNNGVEPASLDPHLIQGVPEYRIYNTLFEGLVIDDPKTATASPGVAESWEVAEDGLTYTFHLRQTNWSDGQPLTAHDFVNSWRRLADPETAAPYAWYINFFIEGSKEFNEGKQPAEFMQVKALDDYTFQFKTVGAFPFTIDALSHFAFAVLPLHTIKEYGDKWTRPENIVTNGPFLLEEWRPQDKLTVVKNPDYWDADNVKLDTVEFYPIENQQTAMNLYEQGELDWQTSIPSNYLEKIINNNDTQISTLLGVYYVAFQMQRAPFDNPLVRAAFAHAIDKQRLIDYVTKGKETPAKGLVPPIDGYPQPQGLAFDPEKARELLAQAGYPNGEGFPSVPYMYNTSDAHKQVAEFLQQAWKTVLNVDVTLENYEWGNYLSQKNNNDFFISRAGWNGGYRDPNTFLDLFISDTALNSIGLQSPAYDALLQQTYSERDPVLRYKLMSEADKILVEDEAGVLPLYYYTAKNRIDLEKWGGWHTNIMDRHPIRFIYPKK